MKAKIMIWKNTLPLLIGTLIASGCNENNEKIYVCHGEKQSYKDNYNFDTLKFNNFSLVLKPQKSFLSIISDETPYNINGDIFPELNGDLRNYKIFAKRDGTKYIFTFHQINKEFTYVRPNNYGLSEFYYGKCRLTEI